MATLLLFTTIIAYTQPNCFIVGPAYTFGSASIDGYSFSRTAGIGANGEPTFTFSNIAKMESKSRAVGIMMDMYKKHSRIAFDLMFPLKNTPGNPFNFNMAFGGYIKERIGILIGGSFYANTKYFNSYPSDSGTFNSIDITLNDDLTSGNFYNDNFFAQGLGVNALLNIALSETAVIRLDYGIYASDITNKKKPLPENYDWSSNFSRKFEASLVLQAEGEPFGFGLKFVQWTTRGQMIKDHEYTTNGTTQSIDLATMPERTFKLTNFMISLMIPMGNATSTTTIITVK
jgi:hypothetical protein